MGPCRWRSPDDARVDEAHAVEDPLDASGGRRSNGVALDEDGLRFGTQDGLAVALSDLDRHSRWNDGQYEVGISREEVVILEDLDAGAPDALDAGRAAPFKRCRHRRTAFAHPSRD